MASIGPEILTRLINEHGPALMLYARQWCNSPEDVVQEAFLRVVRQSPPPENMLGWLFQVVRNQAINASRSSRRRKQRESAVADESRAWFHATLDERLDAAEAARAMQQLPIEQRETIVARLWGGLTFDEIAQLTGSSTSTVHRWYQLGITELRERLGVECAQKKNKTD